METAQSAHPFAQARKFVFGALNSNDFDVCGALCLVLLRVFASISISRYIDTTMKNASQTTQTY